MNTNPTPDEAAELLAQAQSHGTQARSTDAWPIVFTFFSLSTAMSVGLVAVGLTDGDTATVIITIAALAWLLPAFIVYGVKARSWAKRSTVLVAIWPPLVTVLYLAGAFLDSTMPGTWGPFIMAGLIWALAPIMALIALRR